MQLHSLDAVTARDLMRSKQLSPVELMQAVFERIDNVNPHINALTETFAEQSLAEARIAEARYLHSDYEGSPLLGIPVAAKEKHGIAGRTLSQGLRAHSADVAAEDHPVIARITAAGAIVHARTTSPEFSCATFTQSRLWGVTRNPWSLSHAPGGSSGGSGAALASGFAPLATASDIAGSTRIPASFTGTVGFKAPYGRIPGQAPLSLDHYRGDGPMARTVADTALLANVMSGPHPLDHTTVSSAAALSVELTEADRSVVGLRIALCIRLGDYPVMPEVEANTRAVAAALVSAGAIVEEVTLPWTTHEISEISFTHFGNILGPAMRAHTAGTDELLSDYTLRFMADAAAAASRTTLLDGLTAEARMQAELAVAMTGFDALLCPTSAIPALEADDEYLEGIDIPLGDGDSDGVIHLEHYWQAHLTIPFNINNRCPVLAVPSGMASNGVPTGVQIVGHPFDDAMVFRVGAAIEQVRPWAGRVPSFT